MFFKPENDGTYLNLKKQITPHLVFITQQGSEGEEAVGTLRSVHPDVPVIGKALSKYLEKMV